MESTLETGKVLNIPDDTEEASDFIISLFDKHSIEPARKHAEIIENKCCAVGVISRELGNERGGSGRCSTNFSPQFTYGLMFGFDGVDKPQCHDVDFDDGFKLGKRTSEKLIEQGRM